MTTTTLEQLNRDVEQLAKIVSRLQVQFNDAQQELAWLRDCILGEVPF